MFSLLHVDNNFFYREIVHKLSIERDFNYYSAKTPEQAYEILKDNPIDIIITGLEFKDVIEEEFIKNLIFLKQATTALIVLSAYENLPLKESLFKLGITEFIRKENFLKYLKNMMVRLESKDCIVTKLKQLKIAVLDDDSSQLTMIRDMLNKNKIFNVDFFHHPNELLSTKEKYNIYLVDFILPDISGEDVIVDLRTRDEYAVIIAVSSITGHPVISNLLMNGADDFIRKPITENLLIARLKANVRTYSLMEQLKEKNEKLAKLAMQDGLTGLYNHRHIIEALDIEIDRANRYNSPLSVVMFDVDHFKAVNDCYGHHMGDIVLSEIGSMWNIDCRKIDIAGRYGGEEFVVILPNTDLAGAKIYSERIRSEIEKKIFGKDKIRVTISGGIATYEDENAVDLIKKADKKLYDAKRNGRNRIE